MVKDCLNPEAELSQYGINVSTVGLLQPWRPLRLGFTPGNGHNG